jgi:hypothetical protein
MDRCRFHRDFFPKLEIDKAICQRDDYASADHSVGHDIELLSDACAEHANQVVGVCPGEGSSVARDLIGDPSATGHASPQQQKAIS